MKSGFFPRMPSSPKAIFIKLRISLSRRGTLSLFPVFIIFLFLGISVLILTQIHLRLGGIRRHLALTNLAAENGLKMGYLFLWEKAQESSWPLTINNSDWQLLTAKPDEKLCLWLLSRLLKIDFPFYLQSGWENMSWKTDYFLGSTRIDFLNNYIQAEIPIYLRAEGKTLASSYSAYSQLLIKTNLLAGYLPLTIFPLLIEKKLTLEEQSTYLQSKKIELALDNKTLPAIKPYFSQEEMISRDIVPFLEKGLKIRIFEPNRINPLVLRQALGLEVSREPIPEGVYLIKDDLGLGGVFVQGNLDSLRLAIEDGYQIISFQKIDKIWELRYHPFSSETLWKTPEKNFVYNSVPNGIILINGDIGSFGGKQEGKEVATIEDSPPCLLPGIRLCFVVSGNINITSPLFEPNLEILPGIPYIQKKQSQTIIYSAGKDLIIGEENKASIIINPGKRKEMIIQANLTAPGKGIKIEGSNKEVIIKGGIQATEIENPTSNLKIVPSAALFNFLKTEDLVPLTEKPIAALIRFKPLEWRENERVYSN